MRSIIILPNIAYKTRGLFNIAKIAHSMTYALLLFALAWFGGWLGHACTDYNTMHPYDIPIRAADSVVMREILDSNGLSLVSVNSVCNSFNGFVSEINLSRKALSSFHFPDIARKLTYLRRADLSRNNLSEVPGKVWALPALRELILDSNQLSVLTDTLFSAGEKLAEGLTLLSISHNRLESVPHKSGTCVA